MKTRKRKLIRRLYTLVIAVIMLCSSMTALAAEPTNEQPRQEEVAVEQPIVVPMTAMAEAAAQPRSGASGYAASYTNSLSSSFKVNVSGNSSSGGTIQFHSWDFAASGAVMSVSVFRPDGTAAASFNTSTNAGAIKRSFSNAIPGNYTINYKIAGTNKGWLEAWVTFN